jgi:hypothetical protein
MIFDHHNGDKEVWRRSSGGKESTAISYYTLVRSRSVSCEVHLEAGEYIVFVSFFNPFNNMWIIPYIQNEFVA